MAILLKHYTLAKPEGEMAALQSDLATETIHREHLTSRGITLHIRQVPFEEADSLRKASVAPASPYPKAVPVLVEISLRSQAGERLSTEYCYNIPKPAPGEVALEHIRTFYARTNHSDEAAQPQTAGG